jgi:predicted Fe-Mo cluster-binding NifX family protein
MKIALPLDENKKDICVSFGRAPFFMFSEDGKNEILANPAADAPGGAGIKAAQFIVDSKADALITVRCGQNAADVFKAAGMKIYKSEGPSAADNVAACLEGKLSELSQFHAGYHGIK